MNKRKTVICDLDGILSLDIGPYKDRLPIIRNIKKLNNLARKNKIIIMTSRYKKDRKTTFNWLMKNNVRFDELILGKRRYWLWIDDKCRRMDEI